MPTKRKVGRPTDYKEEYGEQVYKLCLLGATDKDLADFFEVDEATVNRWKLKHPEFCESIKKGKKTADANVGHSLYQRATGYDDVNAIHISNFQGIITETPIVKHYPPDTTAQIFWLKNRDKPNWRDKQDHEVTGKDGSAIVINYKPEKK